MAKIDLERISEDTTILSAVANTPWAVSHRLSPFQQKEIVLLSSEGKLGSYNPTTTADAFHPLIDLRDVKGVEFNPAEISAPVRFHIATLYCMTMGLLWLSAEAFMIYDLIANFGSYYNAAPTQSASEVASSTVLMFLPSLIIMGVLMGGPFIVNSQVNRWASRDTLSLWLVESPSGEPAEERRGVGTSLNSLDDCFVLHGQYPYSFRIGIWWLSLILLFPVMLPMIIQGEFLVFFIIFEVLFVGFWMGASLLHTALFKRRQDSSQGTINEADLESFHATLSKMLGQDPEEKIIRLMTLEIQLGDRITELKSRLENHDQLLNDLIERWRDIYHAPAPYMGMTTIRRCTEKLLYHRLRGHGIKPRKTNRGLNSMRQLLVSKDALSTGALQHLDVIAGMTNPTAHDFDMSEMNYITSLRSFVEFVDWHFDNIPADEESE